MKLTVKKNSTSLLAFLGIYTLILLSFIFFNGITDDLEWYISDNRMGQFGYIGIDKSRVSIFIDLFETESMKLLIACFLVSAALTLAIFTTRVSYKSQFRFWFMLFALILVNIYVIQLSMHLWRQSIGLFLFLAFLNVNNPLQRLFLLLLSSYFHEVFFFISIAIIPFLVYKSINKFILFPLVCTGVIFIDVRLAVCLIFNFINKERDDIYYRYLAATNVFLTANIGIPFILSGAMYDTVSERFLILTSMLAVVSFCLCLLGGRGLKIKRHYILGLLSLLTFIFYGVLREH